MLKKHLKKIVSLVLVTMMAIGMSITAIAAEPYQNELEAVMDSIDRPMGEVSKFNFLNLSNIFSIISSPHQKSYFVIVPFIFLSVH